MTNNIMSANIIQKWATRGKMVKRILLTTNGIGRFIKSSFSIFFCPATFMLNVKKDLRLKDPPSNFPPSRNLLSYRPLPSKILSLHSRLLRPAL